MNYRNPALTRLAYELDCQLQIPDVCTGGVGEPCHANWQLWGKNGGGEKAPDWAIASGCRACHMAIDQGSKLPDHLREHYWMRGHVRTMNELWGRSLIGVTVNMLVDSMWRVSFVPPEPPKPRRKRKSRCTASSKTVPRRAGGFSP